MSHYNIGVYWLSPLQDGTWEIFASVSCMDGEQREPDFNGVVVINFNWLAFEASDLIYPTQLQPLKMYAILQDMASRIQEVIIIRIKSILITETKLHSTQIHLLKLHWQS